MGGGGGIPTLTHSYNTIGEQKKGAVCTVGVKLTIIIVMSSIKMHMTCQFTTKTRKKEQFVRGEICCKKEMQHKRVCGREREKYGEE